jgi:hypothetical protein
MLCIRSTKLLTVLPGFRATSSPLDTVVSLPDLRFIPPSTTAYGGWQADNQQDATRLGFFPGFRLPPPPPLHSTLDDSPTLALLLTSLHFLSPNLTNQVLARHTDAPTPHLTDPPPTHTSRLISTFRNAILL